MGGYQKGKTNLDFTEARDSERRWHQLGICKSAPHSRQTTMPAPNRSVFLQAGCLSCCPTNSVKALKAKSPVFRRRKSGNRTLQCWLWLRPRRRWSSGRVGSSCSGGGSGGRELEVSFVVSAQQRWAGRVALLEVREVLVRRARRVSALLAHVHLHTPTGAPLSINNNNDRLTAFDPGQPG